MKRAASPKKQSIRSGWRAAALALLASGCVSFPPAPAPHVLPHIDGDRLIASDGAALGLEVWRAPDAKAVIVALHGMNDYGHAFEDAGQYWSHEAGITLYAYDQRGFGRSPGFGRWAGEGALKADLAAAIAAARAENPGLPLYVLGHSMGAAVVMAAAADGALAVDGVILAAPGVWGGSRLPLAYRATLNVAAGVAPGKTLTGERAKRQATDNIPVLRAMLADPLVIKETRLDAVLGVVRLMGRAWDASDEIGGRVLFLYGDRDEIIPLKALRKTARRLCGAVAVRNFADGWHLLFRDLAAAAVWREVAAWVAAEADETDDAASPELGFGPAASSCVDAGRESQRGVAVRRPDRAVAPMGERAPPSVDGRALSLHTDTTYTCKLLTKSCNR